MPPAPGDCVILQSALDAMPAELAGEIRSIGLVVSCERLAGGYTLDYRGGELILETPGGEQLQASPGRIHNLDARQPFTRALAPTRGGLVIDATAGLGGDTLMLARLAARVIAIEAHPVVCALLLGTVHAARQQGYPGADNITVCCGDAVERLPALPMAEVIYLDPMFPPKKRRSALPPKPVRILRELVGDSSQSERLLVLARRLARRRVVVKRPLHAPPLAGDAVAVHVGKVVRYEVYLPAMETT